MREIERGFAGFVRFFSCYVDVSAPALDSTPPQHLTATRARRNCNGIGCGRQISCVALDPHIVCVKCQGGACKPNHRCDECKDWDEGTVLKLLSTSFLWRQNISITGASGEGM